MIPSSPKQTTGWSSTTMIRMLRFSLETGSRARGDFKDVADRGTMKIYYIPRPMSHHVLIAVLLALCGSPDIRAAEPQQPVNREFAARVWRTQDGLPENMVQAISGTPDGYLWIGTA